MPVDKARASFTLQGGQLLLAPRMHLKPPGYKYQHSKCRAVDPQKIECPLDNLTIYTWPAPMSFTQNLIEQRSLSEKHRQLLSRLHPCRSRRWAGKAWRIPSGAYRCRYPGSDSRSGI